MSMLSPGTSTVTSTMTAMTAIPAIPTMTQTMPLLSTTASTTSTTSTDESTDEDNKVFLVCEVSINIANMLVRLQEQHSSLRNNNVPLHSQIYYYIINNNGSRKHGTCGGFDYYSGVEKLIFNIPSKTKLSVKGYDARHRWNVSTEFGNLLKSNLKLGEDFDKFIRTSSKEEEEEDDKEEEQITTKALVKIAIKKKRKRNKKRSNALEGEGKVQEVDERKIDKIDRNVNEVKMKVNAIDHDNWTACSDPQCIRQCRKCKSMNVMDAINQATAGGFKKVLGIPLILGEYS